MKKGDLQAEEYERRQRQLRTESGRERRDDRSRSRLEGQGDEPSRLELAQVTAASSKKMQHESLRALIITHMARFPSEVLRLCSKCLEKGSEGCALRV